MKESHPREARMALLFVLYSATMGNMYIDPIAFEIGGWEVRWYSLFLALALLFSYFSFKRALRQRLNRPEFFCLGLLIGALAGARLGYFLFYIPASLARPWEILAIWRGGLSFHGGLIGGAAAILYLGRKHQVPVRVITDLASVIGVFALAVGRLGNQLNGRLIGTPFDGSWCAVSQYDQLCRHPYPIYAFLSHLILGAYLCCLLYKHRRSPSYVGSGWLTINFLIAGGLLRVFTDIWKEDLLWGGIKVGQWLSIAMVILGLIMLTSKTYDISKAVQAIRQQISKAG